MSDNSFPRHTHMNNGPKMTIEVNLGCQICVGVAYRQLKLRVDETSSKVDLSYNGKPSDSKDGIDDIFF